MMIGVNDLRRVLGLAGAIGSVPALGFPSAKIVVLTDISRSGTDNLNGNDIRPFETLQTCLHVSSRNLYLQQSEDI